MKVSPTTTDCTVKLFPDRLKVSLTRLAATRRTATAAKFAVGANRLCTALAAHTTGAMRLCSEFLIQIVFKHYPSTKFCADGDKGMHYSSNFLRAFANPASTRRASTTPQMVIGSNDFFPASALQAASTLPVISKLLLIVVLKNRQPTENCADGDKGMPFCVG